jgi:hypothetical protein
VPFFKPVILCQFIDEYNARRTSKLGTTWGFIGNTISAYSGGANTIDIEKTCIDYKTNFGTAETPEEWVKLILSLGNTAWHSQDRKVSASSFSDFCQTLHAIRSYILMTLKTTPGANEVENDFKEQLTLEINDKIKEIKEARQREEQNLYVLINRTPSNDSIQEKKTAEKIKECTLALDNAVRDLAYLGDNYYVLVSQRIKKLFPSATFPEAEPADLPHVRIKQDDSLKPNPRIPAILHLNYVDIFLRTHGKPPVIERAVFEDLTKKKFDRTYNQASSAPNSITSDSPQSGGIPGTIAPLQLTISTNNGTPINVEPGVVPGSSTAIFGKLGISTLSQALTQALVGQASVDAAEEAEHKSPANDGQVEAAQPEREERKSRGRKK